MPMAGPRPPPAAVRHGCYRRQRWTWCRSPDLGQARPPKNFLRISAPATVRLLQACCGGFLPARGRADHSAGRFGQMESFASSEKLPNRACPVRAVRTNCLPAGGKRRGEDSVAPEDRNQSALYCQSERSAAAPIQASGSGMTKSSGMAKVSIVVVVALRSRSRRRAPCPATSRTGPSQSRVVRRRRGAPPRAAVAVDRDVMHALAVLLEELLVEVGPGQGLDDLPHHGAARASARARE